MLNFERTETPSLYANFLTLENKEGASIVDPKITIRHVKDGLTIVDIFEQPMSFAIETLYYYKWNIPSMADLGVYTVEYQAIIDGEYAEANESFNIVEFGSLTIGCDLYYTDADKVAAYLGVEATDIQEDWLAWASRYIDFYTGQKFCQTTSYELYDIDRPNESTLMLDHFPIIDVLQVTNDGTVMDMGDIAVYRDEGFIKIKDIYTRKASRILETGSFVMGRQSVEVIYKHGYNNIPKQVEWAATVLAASIAAPSLTQSGTLSVGDVVEEEIGDYRRKKSVEESGSTSFSTNIENSKNVNKRLEEDVFSAKTVLRLYRGKDMRAV